MARDLPPGLDAIWRNIETAQPAPVRIEAQREQIVAIAGTELEQRRRVAGVPGDQFRQRADPVSVVVPGGYSNDPAIHFRKTRRRALPDQEFFERSPVKPGALIENPVPLAGIIFGINDIICPPDVLERQPAKTARKINRIGPRQIQSATLASRQVRISRNFPSAIAGCPSARTVAVDGDSASIADQRPKINFCKPDVSGVGENGRFFAPGYMRGKAKKVAV